MAKGEIEIFVKELPHTPGWVALSQVDKEWLQKETSDARTLFRDTGLSAVKFCIKIVGIQAGLEGKTVTFTNWVRSCFGPSERTAYRWLAAFNQLTQAASLPVILYLAEEGLAGVNSTIQPGELVPVLKALPAPKTTDKKTLDAYRDKVSTALQKRRARRGKRDAVKLDREEALRTWVTTTIRLVKEVGLETSADKRAWLEEGLGYSMDRLAIAGTVSSKRTSMPDGWLPKRGAPTKEERLRKAAAAGKAS